MVENQISKIVYIVGNSAEFAFPVPFFDAGNIHCYLANGMQADELTPGSDYSVEVLDDYSHGANIILKLDPLPAGAKLAICRELPIRQMLNLPEHGKLPSSQLEKAFDKLIMICQELQTKLNSCVALDVTSSENTADLLESVLTFRESAPALLEQMRSIANECRRYKDIALSSAVENAVGYVKIADTVIPDPRENV